MSQRTLILGTRGSQLALEQARRVQDRLPGPSKLRIIRTSGDRFQDKPLHEHNGVGLFTKEIEQELIEARIDLAVHSLKDLPIQLTPGLCLGAVLARDEASDLLLVSSEALDPQKPLVLKPGARVGASSLRRQALLKAFRKDLVPEPIRGNVPTRLRKAEQGEYDAIVIARAGLSRLAMAVEPLLAFDLNPCQWPCAAGQGAIAVECREQDAEVLGRLSGLEHPPTRACVEAERAVLWVYGGGCHAPFGVLARRQARVYRMDVAAPGPQGDFVVRAFEAVDLDVARQAAEEWIGLGCPVTSEQEEEAWICRPALPWC